MLVATLRTSTIARRYDRPVRRVPAAYPLDTHAVAVAPPSTAAAPISAKCTLKSFRAHHPAKRGVTLRRQTELQLRHYSDEA